MRLSGTSCCVYTNLFCSNSSFGLIQLPNRIGLKGGVGDPPNPTNRHRRPPRPLPTLLTLSHAGTPLSLHAVWRKPFSPIHPPFPPTSDTPNPILSLSVSSSLRQRRYQLKKRRPIPKPIPNTEWDEGRREGSLVFRNGRILAGT